MGETLTTPGTPTHPIPLCQYRTLFEFQMLTNVIDYLQNVRRYCFTVGLWGLLWPCRKGGN